MKVYKIKVNGKSYRVELESIEEESSPVSAPAAAPAKAEKKEEAPKPQPTNVAGQEVTSPIQGVVNDVKVKIGDKVKKGTVLLIIEAMKLENEVVSPYDGEVVEVLVAKGQNVASKERIVVIR